MTHATITGLHDGHFALQPDTTYSSTANSMPIVETIADHWSSRPRLQSIDQAELENIRCILRTSWNRPDDKTSLRKLRTAAKMLSQKLALINVDDLQSALESILGLNPVPVTERHMGAIDSVRSAAGRTLSTQLLSDACGLLPKIEPTFEGATQMMHPAVLATLVISEIAVRRHLVDLLTDIAQKAISTAQSVGHIPTTLSEATRDIEDLLSSMVLAKDRPLPQTPCEPQTRTDNGTSEPGTENSGHEAFIPKRDADKEHQDRLRDVEITLRNHAKSVRCEQPCDVAGESVVLRRPEIDAFKSTYLNENTFRAEFARATVQLAIFRTRYAHVRRLLEKSASTTYLWQKPAQEAQWLEPRALDVIANAEEVQRKAGQRMLQEKETILKEYTDALRSTVVSVSDVVRQKLASEAPAAKAS